MTPEELRQAHSHSYGSKAEIKSSEICGCFYCLKTYPPGDIDEWVPGEETPICPRCGIDSVIGSKSGLPVTDESFLREMREHFFGEIPEDEFEDE